MTDSPKNSSDAAPTCFFVTDGTGYVPTRLARGPWGPSISGNYVGGLLGRAVELEVDDVDLQPARLTVDLLRPVALKPLQMHSSVVRDGRRLRLVDAVMTQNDVIVARASALFLRRSEHTTVDTVWTSPVTMPAIPADPVMLAGDVPMVLQSYGRDPVAATQIAALGSTQRTGVGLRTVTCSVGEISKSITKIISRIPSSNRCISGRW